MKTNRHIFVTGLLAFAVLALFPRMAAAQEMKTLRGHVPAAISRLNLRPFSFVPPDTTLNLTISLQVQNENGLDDLLQQIYDPLSPNYHHYLTPKQFYQQFGPGNQAYQAAINFAKTAGLAVTGVYSNQMILDVRGRASDIQKAFNVNLYLYHHPAESRDFYAPDRDPTVNAALPIMHVSGLDNYVIPHPLYHKMSIKPSSSRPNSGSGPGGTYMGKDFRAAYAPGVALDGTGQTIGLFELDGYYAVDIAAYEAQAGLPNVPLVNVAVDGGVILPQPPNSDPGVGEVSLDIEMDISMATNASEVIVYEAPNNGVSSVDVLNRIASDDIAKQISSSWGIGDDPAFDVYYKQMALQGQSFFQASGDDGAYYTNDEATEEYADDPNITLVGGTTLYTTGVQGPGPWSSETVWSWFVEDPGQGLDYAGGGGTNYNGIPIPSWQQGISMTANQGSTTLRNVPDVAMTADNIYVTWGGGINSSFGGTSCAAPLWAAFTALVNQQALAGGSGTVGFLNPAIYAIGKSGNYTTCFHDITTGNNTNLTVANNYFAVPGYDLCTGWGTPNGANLINALAAIPAPVSAPPPPYGTNMAALDGGNPNGNWYLFVQDDQTFNSGVISNGWAVTLTTADPIGYVADDYMAMTAAPTNVLVGYNASVSISVTNYGPSVSSNVVVFDTLPLGFTLVNSSTATGYVVPGGEGLAWDIGTLPVSASAQLNLTIAAPGTPEQSVINSAVVSATTPDQNTSDDSAYATMNVISATPPSVSPAIGSGKKFELTVTGADAPVIIQASTNLINWVDIDTNTPPFVFTDTVTTTYPQRFYRALYQ